MSYSWPTYPYKGLSYYTAEDIALFAGRDAEIDLCADLLTTARGQIIILHGSTGCGKSSFLRAGLIPALEGDAYGFHFLKTDGGFMPLFVRSTHAPLERLAEALFAFASTPYQLETPVESRTIDLSSTLPTSDLIEFRRRLGRSARSTFEFVERLCERFHRTLTLIIDQAEEVLTLSEGRTRQRAKNFSRFLR